MTVCYRKGGRALDLKMAAERVRRKGMRGDTVLAHINRQEADFLKKHGGMDVNPHTGLPSFGLFRSIEKALRKPVKKILPVAGGVLGNMLAGPAGGFVGGTLGGALSSKKHRRDHAAAGAAIGAGLSYVLPKMGEMMDVDPESGAGKVLGMGHEGLMGGMGRGSSPKKGSSGYSAGDQEKGSDFDILSPAGIKKMVDIGLPLVSIAGALGSRTKIKNKGPSIGEQMEEYHRQRANEKPRFEVKELKSPNSYRPAPKSYRHGIDPEWQFFSEDERYGVPPAPYAHGGPVLKGYIKGRSGGQTDDVYGGLPEGSYVMDATTVSLLGDGNSDHGAEKIHDMVSRFERGGITRDVPFSQRTKVIKAAVSDGEYVISPEKVAAIGDGDNNVGAKKLDKMRNKLRKQKGVKKFLPPKSKHFTHYMR